MTHKTKKIQQTPNGSGGGGYILSKIRKKNR